MAGKPAAGEKRRGRPRKKCEVVPSLSPSLAPDAALRQPSPPPPTPPPARRSVRRRRPPRMDDFAEYGDNEDDLFYYQHLSTDEEVGKEEVVDDEEESEGTERSRRGKKFKLLQKLPNHHHRRSLSPSSSFSGKEGGSAGREPLDKGRRSDAVRAGDGKADNYGDGRNVRCIGSGSDNAEEDGRKCTARKCDNSDLGKTMDQFSLSTPLPDKKMLEAVLEKLQKKDIYGVYAEPVDPEELPDYHDIIKHPMDFGTIRKKLVAGVYCKLEQFESDIFLLCLNAMQYNAPDTIYFRQARSIQELAKRKFQSIRFCSEGAGKAEHKPQAKCIFDSEYLARSEQKPNSNSLSRKVRKKSLCKTVQSPNVSEMPLMTTCTATDDTGVTEHKSEQPSPAEQPVIANVFADCNLACEHKLEKVDEHPAKNSPAKLEKKIDVSYEDRRGTYDTSRDQLMIESDSLFIPFGNEQKLLAAVGVDAPYSYARSLARFAGSLGPTGWKIASEKIEKVLPEGVKFGPGWIGEYEPLLSPILFLESHASSSHHFSQTYCWKGRREDGSDRMKYGKSSTSQILRPDVCSSPRVHGLDDGSQPMIMHNRLLQCKPPDLVSPNQSNSRVGVNISSFKGNSVVDIAARYALCTEVTNSRVPGLISDSINNKVGASLVPENAVSGVSNRGFPGGNHGEKIGGSSREGISNDRTNKLDNYFCHGGSEKVLDDSIELMRSMPVPSPGGNYVTAVPAAGPVWMSAAGRSRQKVIESHENLKMQVGAASVGKISSESLAACGFRNNTRLTHSVPLLPRQAVNEVCHTPGKNSTVCPQFVATELPRSWGQMPRQGLTPNVQSNKDVRTPDLSTFTDPRSPALQSSGIPVDPQQPDLALQL